ncbi:MAG: UvrB/UvrC motif-containing protein [Chitinivibrionales bacterium]|nr:UvrB/UvrC motif-containing protein [Chitinivibrionales bacterium]
MESKLCDECNLNQANIHLTQIVQDEVSVLHLCEECARKKGISIVIEHEQQPGAIDQSDDSTTTNKEQSSDEKEKEIHCSVCHTSLTDFKSNAMLGCPACYSAFAKEVDTLLLQIHGSNSYKGSRRVVEPIPVQETSDIEALRMELCSAIRQEKFELAALLRDRINRVKSQTQHSSQN